MKNTWMIVGAVLGAIAASLAMSAGVEPARIVPALIEAACRPNTLVRRWSRSASAAC